MRPAWPCPEATSFASLADRDFRPLHEIMGIGLAQITASRINLDGINLEFLQ
jgi:hypothetical protein